MICAVTYEHRERFSALLDDMHVARHKLYVEGRKWRELAQADGREVDQFDRKSTVYFLALGQDGNLQGGLRIVPSTEPHMLDSLFPELCTIGDIPRGPEVWEMSRVFVNHSDACDEEGLIIKGKLMCSMIEFAQQHGIKKITGVTDSYFLPRLLQIGGDIKPLGLPQPYDSGEMVAIQITVDDELLGKARHHYKVPHSVLVDCDSVYQRAPEPEIAYLNEEIELLKDRGFVSQHERFLQEFLEVVIELGNEDQSVVCAAEAKLDELTERVKKSKRYGQIGLMESHRLQ